MVILPGQGLGVLSNYAPKAAAFCNINDSSEAPRSGKPGWIFCRKGLSPERFQALSLWITAISLTILFPHLLWWSQLVSASEIPYPFVYEFYEKFCYFMKSFFFGGQRFTETEQRWEEGIIYCARVLTCDMMNSSLGN